MAIDTTTTTSTAAGEEGSEVVLSETAAATAAADDGYIQTTTLNYVSRQSTIAGSQHVELKGRSVVSAHVLIRGDLAIVRMGRYCVLHAHTRIQPPPMPGRLSDETVAPEMTADGGSGSGSDSSRRQSGSTGTRLFIPVSIGSHTVIGSHCTIQAAAVGSSCWIESNVTLGPRCILKDCCVVTAGTVIPADTVLPPFTRASTNKLGRLVTQTLPPAMAVELQEKAVEAFQSLVWELQQDERRRKEASNARI